MNMKHLKKAAAVSLAAFCPGAGVFTGGFSRSRDDSRLWRRKESIGAVITAGSADGEN